VGLVIASCPRQYLRAVAARKAQGARIPADMGDAKDFLSAFRRTVGSHCKESMVTAVCVATVHARKRKSTKLSERKLYIAVKMDNNFPHTRVTTAFKENHGIDLKFSFKFSSFASVLQHMMAASGQSAEEMQKAAATYPPKLDCEAELAADAASKKPAKAVAEEPPEAIAEVENEEIPALWDEDEGESTDADEEAPADSSLRGQSTLVTASCPRHYPAEKEERQKQSVAIPEDFTKAEFLEKLRKIFAQHTSVRTEKASCHSEPHKRYNKRTKKRARHFHVAMKVSGNFAHKKVAQAFHKKHGLHISFSFKLNRFVGNLQYLMTAGKKPSTDLDLEPAVFPPTLKPAEELQKAKHPGDEPAKEGRKRKRLSFDEVSNVIIEGIGDGPLRTGRQFEKAAKALKEKGQVELWNFMGTLKNSAEAAALVARVWHLHGETAHAMWRQEPEFPLADFNFCSLKEVEEWRRGKWKTHVLVLSGDGGLCKTSAAEALIDEVAPGGFWFLDDPDDVRELEGLMESGHGFVVDEISLNEVKPNQVKKLYDVQKARRIKCRHFNASIPKGCPRIFCTNSPLELYYPPMKNPHDRTGVFRRHLFQVVRRSLRASMFPTGADAPGATPSAEASGSEAWKERLADMCARAKVDHHLAAAVEVAESLGVALPTELAEVLVEIADGVRMKVLERKRFLSQ